MKQIAKYTIVTASNPRSLAVEVSNMLKNSWQPYGDMVALALPESHLYDREWEYCQPMVIFQEGTE